MKGAITASLVSIGLASSTVLGSATFSATARSSLRLSEVHEYPGGPAINFTPPGLEFTASGSVTDESHHSYGNAVASDGSSINASPLSPSPNATVAAIAQGLSNLTGASDATVRMTGYVFAINNAGYPLELVFDWNYNLSVSTTTTAMDDIADASASASFRTNGANVLNPPKVYMSFPASGSLSRVGGERAVVTLMPGMNIIVSTEIEALGDASSGFNLPTPGALSLAALGLALCARRRRA